MKLTVNVTQEDIDNGRRRTCSGCPVALAISRAWGKRITVGPNDFGASHESIPLPREAMHFVELFDRGHAKTLLPFSFVVEVPT